jgi:3-deoxy-manno-octulosonate cytidylyltransferase (CMP-KDO synthetase)
MKKTLGVIPARMASSRFPGKPLEKILGIPMVAHCYERALLSETCDTLIVATPDQEIIDWGGSHGIPTMLTSHEHQRATERAKEALDILASQGKEYDFILLLQGDEPQISPKDIQNLKNAFSKKEFEVVNLIFPIEGDDLLNQNVVKAVIDNNLNINFFTRSHVPHNSSDALRQLGMIGFTKAVLQEYTKLLPTPLEELESIDMMRLLENDLPIKGVLSSSPILGVDTPEDINKAEQMMMQDELIDLYKEKYK